MFIERVLGRQGLNPALVGYSNGKDKSVKRILQLVNEGICWVYISALNKVFDEDPLVYFLGVSLGIFKSGKVCNFPCHCRGVGE